jgi:MscS family membrane protein
MQEFLDVLILDNTIRQWLYALCFVAGGFVGGKLCSLITSSFIKYVCHKTKFRFDDIILGAVKGPLTLMVTLAGIAFGFDLLTLHETIKVWGTRVLTSVVIAVIAWAITAILDALITQYIPVKSTGLVSKQEVDIQPMLRKLFRTVLWIFAGALILKNLGYNISALMAGLGLGGAALALASRDTLANFFGSITVFVDRPFRLNDRIKIAGYDGFITEMGIRTSRLRTMENRIVIIPNSMFTANPIENITAEPNTKVTQTLSIKTSQGQEKIDQTLKILHEIGSTTEGTSGNPSAGLVTIGGNACQITFSYYSAQNADYMDTVNRVNLTILRRFEEEGILWA